jgi:hypothetical protein
MKTFLLFLPILQDGLQWIAIGLLAIQNIRRHK